MKKGNGAENKKRVKEFVTRIVASEEDVKIIEYYRTLPRHLGLLVQGIRRNILPRIIITIKQLFTATPCTYNLHYIHLSQKFPYGSGKIPMAIPVEHYKLIFRVFFWIHSAEKKLKENGGAGKKPRVCNPHHVNIPLCG